MYWNQLGLTDGVTLLWGDLSYVNDFGGITMVFLSFLITGFLGCCYCCSIWFKKIKKHEKAEMWWTILPGIWVFILSFPSLGTLYKMEVQKRLSHFLLEVTAHQWYWHYSYTPNFWMMMRGTSYPVYHSRAGPPHLWEYAEDEALMPSPRVKNIPIEFDSFMKQDFELETGEYRLMDVNHRAIICAGQKTLFSLTSEDVIHSWYVPSLGMKMDAVPGKHNIFRLEPLRSGVYYGMCAELCGVNHSYMPIVVEVLPYKAFKKWEILTALIVKYGKGRYTGWGLPKWRDTGPRISERNMFKEWWPKDKTLPWEKRPWESSPVPGPEAEVPSVESPSVPKEESISKEELPSESPEVED